MALIEETTISIWLRESGAAFFSVLTIHSLALAFVVGINIGLCLHLLGLFPRLKLQDFNGFFPIHWSAAFLVLLSGLGLLLAYPAKALTNPVFYLKLTAILLALFITLLLQRSPHQIAARELVAEHGKVLAVAALCFWVIAVSAGRFLAYTHNVLLASRFF